MTFSVLIARLAAAALAIFAAIISGGPPRPASAAHLSPAIPLAARALAARLHFHGAPFVGNQPQGNAGPWTIWARPSLARAPRILSVGPLGARAAFDYFVPAAERSQATSAEGKVLPVGKAKQLARSWLHQAGVTLPAVPVKVIRTDGTIIGGTGLCCWRQNVDMILFGGHRDQYGLPVDQLALVYVLASGEVVQANVTPQGTKPYPMAPRCAAHQLRDSRGVLVGTSCFSYPVMAGLMWPVDLGGHQPYLVGPGWFSTLAAVQARLTTLPNPTRLHTVFSGPNRAVYTASKGAITYRFTQIAAFPGLWGSTWPLVATERVR